MTDQMMFTPEQIRKAVAALKDIRPAYTAILDFYEQVFVAQESAKSRIKIEPIRISKETVALKMQEKFPLISVSDFVIDTKTSGELFKELCGIAENGNKTMAISARAISDGIGTDPEKLFSAMLGGDDDCFDKIADEFETDKAVLVFITFNSIMPSLNLCAEQLSTYLGENNDWMKGYCPICGNPPAISMFQAKSPPSEKEEFAGLAEGERLLFCGFCWHCWPIRRIYCPFCENKDTETLHYFYSEAEEEYRVDGCDNCKKYMKTVDARKTGRILYPPLEQVATLHLDIKAGEAGFEGGTQ
ncbi:formate dehydrogenase accessory protein FdhE [Desulfococcaceae bacterium HSG8]|nr:formate dehydrogenase accessory protein FdhE [Desulfococcaceae bacterium HSG8]